MTADCSICGSGVPVQRAGNGVACQTARKQARVQYKKAHPLRTGGRQASEHRLSDRDGTNASCVVCGPVDAFPRGRGYMCGNRARELGWTVPGELAQQCATCGAWLTAKGKCRPCTSRVDKDLAYGLMVLEHGQRQTVPLWAVEALHLAQENPLPQYESVVPRWKTLGSDKSWTEVTRVRPEYAALYGG